MAKTKEVKPCARGETCEKTLPLSSKFDLCETCRNHDKSVSERDPHWLRARLKTCARWSCAYADHLPKQERQNVVIEYAPKRSNVTPIRKRA